VLRAPVNRENPRKNPSKGQFPRSNKKAIANDRQSKNKAYFFPGYKSSIFCSKYMAVTKTTTHGGSGQLSRIEEFHWIQIPQMVVYPFG
jgi:hypothetical protein